MISEKDPKAEIVTPEKAAGAAVLAVFFCGETMPAEPIDVTDIDAMETVLAAARSQYSMWHRHEGITPDTTPVQMEHVLAATETLAVAFGLNKDA